MNVNSELISMAKQKVIEKYGATKIISVEETSTGYESDIGVAVKFYTDKDLTDESIRKIGVALRKNVFGKWSVYLTWSLDKDLYREHLSSNPKKKNYYLGTSAPKYNQGIAGKKNSKLKHSGIGYEVTYYG